MSLTHIRAPFVLFLLRTPDQLVVQPRRLGTELDVNCFEQSANHQARSYLFSPARVDMPRPERDCAAPMVCMFVHFSIFFRTTFM